MLNLGEEKAEEGKEGKAGGTRRRGESTPRRRVKSMVLHSGWWGWDENEAWDGVGRKEKRSTEGLRGSLAFFRVPFTNPGDLRVPPLYVL